MTRNTSTYLFWVWFDGISKDINWLVVWNMNFIVPYIGNVIIPTDFHSIMFQRGRLKTPTSDLLHSYGLVLIYQDLPT